MGGNVKLVNRVRVALFSLYFTIFVQWESFERRIQDLDMQVLLMLGPPLCDPCAEANSSSVIRLCAADLHQSQPLYKGTKWNAHKKALGCA